MEKENSVTKVTFYDAVDERLLKFAVIAARSDGKWVLCKHKERDTYEFPGGHREAGESITDAARRELYEETGALDFTLQGLCAYSVKGAESFDGEETFGLLCYAEIKRFEGELHSEMEKIIITDTLPDNWTYPAIQPLLLDELKRRGLI